MERTNDDSLVELEFSIVPNNCGHFGIGIDMQMCFSHEEAVRVATIMQQLLVQYMPQILVAAALVPGVHGQSNPTIN